MPPRRFLKMRVIKDAVLVPRRDRTDKSQGAGVVRRTPNGLAVVDGTGVRRQGKEYVVAPPTEGVEPTRRIEAALYGGFLFEHFGHFMLESLGRTWTPRLGDDVPIAWLPSTGEALTTWQHDMLDLVGAPADRLVVDGSAGPLAVGELLVPDPGFEVRRFLHPWFADHLARRPATPDGSKIWLSRSALGERAGVAEEAEIETLLAERGWIVVHTEQLPLVEQIELVSRASHIAGIEGSAFHDLLFVSGFRGTIDVFTRQGDANFEVIAETTGWDQVRHPLPGGVAERWTRPSGFVDTRWSGVDPIAVADALEASHRR